MPPKTSDPNGSKGPTPPSIDMRGLKAIEARARAFSMMFKVKPGQKVVILTNTPDVEQEIMNWVAEIGHRHIRNARIEDQGAAHTTIELIKMEARR
jgi:TusA-related sulfurtransferase